jgi:hypothetical protein
VPERRQQVSPPAARRAKDQNVLGSFEKLAVEQGCKLPFYVALESPALEIIECFLAWQPRGGKCANNANLAGQTEALLDKDFHPYITIKLGYTTSVRRQITDSKGRSIAGVKVYGLGYENESVITKKDGHFKLPAHRAVGWLVVVAAKKNGREVAKQRHDVGDKPLKLVLQL